MTQIQKKFGRRRMKWTMATTRRRMVHHEKSRRKDPIAKSHYSMRTAAVRATLPPCPISETRLHRPHRPRPLVSWNPRVMGKLEVKPRASITWGQNLEPLGVSSARARISRNPGESTDRFVGRVKVG